MASKLKKEFIELLEKGKEFRYSVAGLIGYSEVLEEIKKLREDFSRRFEEHDRKFESILKRLEKHDERFESLTEEIKKPSKRFGEYEKVQKDFNEALKRRLDALGDEMGFDE